MSEENIFNLIEQKEEKRKKPPIYRSKYPGDLPPTSSTFGNIVTSNVCGPTNMGGEIEFKTKRSHIRIGGTFGPNATVPFPEVQKPTKGTESLPAPQKFTYQGPKKEEVPKANETNVLSGLKSESNFVTKNAIHNILMETGQRAPDKPKQIFKHENYGKIPAYLIENKKIVQKEKKEMEGLKKQRKEKRRMQQQGTILSEQERQEILAQLKIQWEKNNKEYQAMTHLIVLDTISKVRRKERLEAKAAQLEKDIETFSKPLVIIRDD